MRETFLENMFRPHVVKNKLFETGNLLYNISPMGYRFLYRLYKNLSDREERKLIRSMLKPGMTALDIGANIGMYSLFLGGLVGSNGRVLAIEPGPENFERLRQAVNHMPNINAIHAALAEKNGQLRLFLSEILNVDHHTYDDGEGRPFVLVEAIALDEHIPIGRPIHFVKIDVQGAELAVLKGAKRMLRENHDVKILFEYWPYGLRAAGHEPSDLLSFLQDLGFTIRPVGISQAKWECLGSTKEDYCNLIAERG